MSVVKKKICERFEPQAWRKVLCKNCFKTQEDHNQLRIQAQKTAESQNLSEQPLPDDPYQRNIIRNCISAPSTRPKLSHSVSVENFLNKNPFTNPTRRSVSPTLSPPTPLPKSINVDKTSGQPKLLNTTNKTPLTFNDNNSSKTFEPNKPIASAKAPTATGSKTSALLAKFSTNDTKSQEDSVKNIDKSNSKISKNVNDSNVTQPNVMSDNKLFSNNDKSEIKSRHENENALRKSCLGDKGNSDKDTKTKTEFAESVDKKQHKKNNEINIKNNNVYKTPTAANNNNNTQAKDVSSSKAFERECGKRENEKVEREKVENILHKLSEGDDNTSGKSDSNNRNLNNNINVENNHIASHNVKNNKFSIDGNQTNAYSAENSFLKIEHGGLNKQDGGSQLINNFGDLEDNYNLENKKGNNNGNNFIANNESTNYNSTALNNNDITNSQSQIINNNNNYNNFQHNTNQNFHNTTAPNFISDQNLVNFNQCPENFVIYANQSNGQPIPSNLIQNNPNYTQNNSPNFIDPKNLFSSFPNNFQNQNINNFNCNNNAFNNNFSYANNKNPEHIVEEQPPPSAQFFYDGTQAGYNLNRNQFQNNNNNNNINFQNHLRQNNQFNNSNNCNNHIENNSYSGNQNFDDNNNYSYDQPAYNDHSEFNNGLTQQQLLENNFKNNQNDERLENFLKSQRLILDDPNFEDSLLLEKGCEDMSSYDYLRSDTILEGKRLLLESLRERNINLEMNNQKLEREKIALNEILTSKKKDYERMKEHLNAAINDLEFQVQRLQADKGRLIDKLQLPESERSSLAAEENIIAELKRKLNEYEYRFEELESENEDLKQEIKDLQLEMTELHDQFREEETIEFRELQKELESAAKNCRILQFKMKKAERHSEQMEIDKGALEEKLKHFEMYSLGTDDRRKTRALEEEIKFLKDSNNRLHKEIEHLEDRRRKGAEELDRSKNALNDADSKRLCLQNEVDNMKHEINKLKDQLKFENKYDSAYNKHSGSKASSTSDPLILNQLTKDIKDSLERETDMKEQLKFAEKECAIMRKKLTELERENEALTLQIQKLTSSNASRFHNKSKFNQLDVKESGMNKEDELTLQAELAEQEVRTLKKSLEETQKENENLLCAIKYLRNKVEQREGSRCATPFGEPKGAREELDKLSKPSEEELELKKQLEESKKEFLVLKDKYELLLEEMEQTNKSKQDLKAKENNSDMEQKWKTLQKDYEKVKTDCAVISKELTSILEHNNDLTKSLSELEKTLDENEKLKKDKNILLKEIDGNKTKIRALEEEKASSEEKLTEVSKSLKKENELNKKIEELEESLKEKTIAWEREKSKIEREANVGCDIATKINKEVAAFNETLQTDKENLLKDKENLVKEKQKLSEERDNAVREKEEILKEKNQLEKNTKHQIQQLKDSKTFDEKQAEADKSKLEKQLKERESRMNEMGLECEAMSKQYDKEVEERKKVEKEKDEIQKEVQALKEKYEKKLSKEKEKRKKSEAFLEDSKSESGLLAKLQKELEDKEKSIEKLNKKLKKAEDKLENAMNGSNSSIPKSESSCSLSRRSSKSDAQFTLEVKDGQKEANASTKEDEINIIDLKELFEKEIELWKSEKEESKKYKEKAESYKKKISKFEKEIDDLKDKLRNESSEKQKLQVKLKLSESDGSTDTNTEVKKPSEEKKVSDFRNKFEKFGGASKSFKRVSVPSALDVLSSNNNSNKAVKDLLKQIEDLEKKYQKERDELSKKNENLKQEFKKESDESKEKYLKMEERLSEISNRHKEVIESLFEQTKTNQNESPSDKKSLDKNTIPSNDDNDSEKVLSKQSETQSKSTESKPPISARFLKSSLAKS